MSLIDANLLIYASIAGTPQHAKARAWLEETLTGDKKVGLPWASLLAFIRIVTNPRITVPPRSMDEAWNRVEEWLAIRSVWIPMPGVQHQEVLGRLLRSIGDRADLVPDAHVAALAIEHGLELCSSDGDFARFPGLRWRNPIAA